MSWSALLCCCCRRLPNAFARVSFSTHDCACRLVFSCSSCRGSCSNTRTQPHRCGRDTAIQAGRQAQVIAPGAHRSRSSKQQRMRCSMQNAKPTVGALSSSSLAPARALSAGLGCVHPSTGTASPTGCMQSLPLHNTHTHIYEGLRSGAVAVATAT